MSSGTHSIKEYELVTICFSGTRNPGLKEESFTIDVALTWESEI
jgi:hypothetical protein